MLPREQILKTLPDFRNLLVRKIGTYSKNHVPNVLLKQSE